MQTNVVNWLDEIVKKYPNKVAFSDVYKEITFMQLFQRAKAIASRLIEHNIIKSPIAVYMEKSVDTIIAFMGIAYSCNFYSPIDIAMPLKRVDRIIDTLEPAAVITTRQLCDGVREFGYQGKLLFFEDMAESDISEEKLDRVCGMGIDTDLLYVLFTSGSTGAPKGVSIAHRSVIDYIDCVTEIFKINENDSFGNQAPFYFDNSILDIYCTIKCGATCHIIPKEMFSQPVLLLRYLKEKRINTIFWVPSALIVVSKLGAFRNVDLKDVLKRVLFCGEVMPNKQLNIWRNFLPDVQYANLYGPTEITDACTCYIVDREFSDDEPLPIGIPMMNTDVLVLDENDKLVTKGEVGELCVRGTSLSMGYYNNPQKTKEVFVQNPLNSAVPEIIYRTGDLVKYNDNGELIYLSRKDFQIKYMGHRIELGEIETAVSSLPEVSLCCCLFDENQQKIVLFIDVNMEKADIIKQISGLIPTYMYPHKVIVVENMPINANGKIDRVKLKELL